MRLTHDHDSNMLRLTSGAVSDRTPGRRARVSGIIDVAENGRLVGVEACLAENGAEAERELRAWRRDPVARAATSVGADGRAYVAFTTGVDDESDVRSSPIELLAEYDERDNLIALSIARRGDGYEISYPSGNQ